MHGHEFVFYPIKSYHEFKLKRSNNSYTFSTLIHTKYIMIKNATTWFLAKVGSHVLGFLGTLLAWRHYCCTKHLQECNYSIIIIIIIIIIRKRSGDLMKH